MTEVYGNLWTVSTEWLCITTNGTLKKGGRCVMGAGCALQARKRFPDLDRHLGEKIRQKGNHVHYLGRINGTENRLLFSFPVKEHWREEADLNLIRRSCEELRALWLRAPSSPIVTIPRPGCGCGQLDYESVRPLLSEMLLEEAFQIITYG